MRSTRDVARERSAPAARARRAAERRGGRIDHAVAAARAARPRGPRRRFGSASRSCLLVEHLASRRRLARTARCFSRTRRQLRVVLGDPDACRTHSCSDRRAAARSPARATVRASIAVSASCVGRVVHHDEMAHARGRGRRAPATSPRARARAARRARAQRAQAAPTMPAPTTIASGRRLVTRAARPSAERIVRVEAQRRLAGDERGAADVRHERRRRAPAVSQPVNTPPVTLSCRQGAPNASWPRACSAAIFADVPVPHGERSYSPPRAEHEVARVGVGRVDGGPDSSM